MERHPVWLLEDALPPSTLAQALAPDLATRAPTLVSWLQSGTCHRLSLPPHATGCTPAQAWRLQQAGYQPPEGGLLAAAWPALWHAANPPDADRIWWALPCHLRVTQHGVTLIDPQQLHLPPDDADALHQAIAADLRDAGLTVTTTQTAAAPSAGPTWQWRLPEDWNPQAPTPECLVGHDIQHTWSQDPSARPWRRLLNLIQMVWHDHPVNQRRDAAGLPVINSVWLFGGARETDLPRRTDALAVTHRTDWSAALKTGDWSRWLQAWHAFEHQQLRPCHEAGRRQALPHLILTGHDHCLSLQPVRPRGLARLWPTPRRDWRARLFGTP